jgi:hypothetical protein
MNDYSADNGARASFFFCKRGKEAKKKTVLVFLHVSP